MRAFVLSPAPRMSGMTLGGFRPTTSCIEETNSGHCQQTVFRFLRGIQYTLSIEASQEHNFEHDLEYPSVMSIIPCGSFVDRTAGTMHGGSPAMLFKTVDVFRQTARLRAESCRRRLHAEPSRVPLRSMPGSSFTSMAPHFSGHRTSATAPRRATFENCASSQAGNSKWCAASTPCLEAHA